jgi:hypothetical protein
MNFPFSNPSAIFPFRTNDVSSRAEGFLTYPCSGVQTGFLTFALGSNQFLVLSVSPSSGTTVRSPFRSSRWTRRPAFREMCGIALLSVTAAATSRAWPSRAAAVAGGVDGDGLDPRC